MQLSLFAACEAVIAQPLAATPSTVANDSRVAHIPAISLWNPWAILWALGEKQFETRHWRFPDKFTGTIYIHAAKTWNSTFTEYCNEDSFRAALLRHLDVVGIDVPEQEGMTYRRVSLGEGIWVKLPMGGMIGQVELTKSVRVEEALKSLSADRADIEEDFGDYSTGRFAWVGTGHRVLEKFIPCIGRQNFWMA